VLLVAVCVIKIKLSGRERNKAISSDGQWLLYSLLGTHLNDLG